ncbi:MAG: hypothetical protein AAFW98_06125 [Pseudomonadota bacterium]
MRIFLVIAASLISTTAIADPMCQVNERPGAFLTTYEVPDGAVKQSVATGTEVEIVTMGSDVVGRPYALIREPGELNTEYGWVFRAYITCR